MANLHRLRLIHLGPLCALALWTGVGFFNPVFAQPPARGEGKTGEQPQQAVQVAEEDIDPDQPIGTSFVINVSVLHEPEPSGNYTVNGAGNILMHVAEVLTPVTVRGKTCTETCAKITDFLKTYIKDAQVTVSIVSVPKRYVTVSGAVRRGGIAVISRRTTLADLLSAVEWTDTADMSQVRITRQTSTQGKESTSLLNYHLDKYMQPDSGKSPDAAQNPILEDKDVIFVPMKSRVAGGVYSVTGQVAKPSSGLALRVNPGLTLREAIAFAGGTTVDANRKRITITRAGQTQPMVVDLDKAEHGDVASNVDIHPDDAIYVEKMVTTAFVEVIGAFQKPGTHIPFTGQLTLVQAITQAGGPSPLAKQQEGSIIRVSDDDAKHTVVIPFKWKDILNKKAKDVALNAGDAVWMASNTPGAGKGPSPIFQYLAPLGYVLGAAGL
jgi:protein involved in polysaccharide export with SLBB domain